MNDTPSSDTQSEPHQGPTEQVSPVPANDHIGRVSVPLRIYASHHAHRLIPAPAALAVAASIGPVARRFRNSAERDDAQKFMRDLLLHTPRADEADVLAEEWLKEKSRVRELFWRPWLLKRSRVLDSEHWTNAHADGRGCVIVFGHLVASWAVAAILTRQGFDHYAVVSPHYWKAVPPGYEGLETLHRRREYGEKVMPRSRIILSDAPPARLLELLETGASMAIAFDVPGWAATPFLGRNIVLGGGPATLAFKTKSKVLPVVPVRRGAGLDLRMLPPLDPSDYPDLRALRVAIAQVFEALVLAHPESVELPWLPSPLVNEVPPPRGAAEATQAPV